MPRDIFRLMQIYNSLTRKKEELVPINGKKVGVYTCGPTVYNYVTIGNWRTYFLGDMVVRSLRYLGYEVDYVMNLTDVGHLTGDNEGDADQGEDRLEKGAKREGKTAWEVADFYSKDFLEGFEEMRMMKPKVFAKATDHIKEQIALVKKLEEKGLSYAINDGIYFDTRKFEEMGYKYGELSNLDEIKEGARVEMNPEKRDPRDFALWKFSPRDRQRDMEWESPWGMGFPGWHLECSAMSMKYLGEQFDIHIGGEDLRSTHHPNEIAQSEGATGKKPFVKYWMHGAFILVDGGRMGKSLGNAYGLKEIKEKGFEAEDLRYFYLTGHYRRQLNFTWEALEAAREARMKLNRLAVGYVDAKERTDLKEDKMDKIKDFERRFLEAVEDDLNMPQALAVVWEAVKSNIADYDKGDLLREFDRILGLDLGKTDEVPEEVRELVKKRDDLRSEGKWSEADKVREEIESKGWRIEDKGGQSNVVRR